METRLVGFWLIRIPKWTIPVAVALGCGAARPIARVPMNAFTVGGCESVYVIMQEYWHRADLLTCYRRCACPVVRRTDDRWTGGQKGQGQIREK